MRAFVLGAALLASFPLGDWTKEIPWEVMPAPKVSSPDPVVVNAALVEVNNTRARRGLRPFIEDLQLRIAAEKAAAIRAARRISGHISGGAGDFACLPAGARASAAGCAVRSVGEPFAACCVYENWTYAGAAVVVGQDGMKYCHLFVRR